MKEAAIMPISELGPGKPVDWLVEGYIARGYKTLYSAFWKSGKTTFLAHLFKAMGKGGMIADFYVKPAKVILISEENPGLWANRRDRLGLGDHVWIGCQPFLGVATLDIWNNYILNAIAPLVEKEAFDLVVFDTYNKLSPILDENASGPAKQALAILNVITDLGAALMLSCHTRKGDSATGQATRGSGFIMGDVDIIIEMDRKEAEKPYDRRRVLKAQSRFDETPPEKVIELREDGQGYEYLGDRAFAPARERIPIITRLIEVCKDCVPEELLKLWPTSQMARPAEQTFRKDLKEGVDEGLWETTGAGKKGDPLRYIPRDEKRASSNRFLSSPPRRGGEMKGHSSPKTGVEMDGHSSHLSTPPIGEEKKEAG